MSPKDEVAKSLHYPLNIDDHQQMKAEILKPLTYYRKHRETRKSKFFKLMGHWFQISPDIMAKITTILENTLDLYLVYDDILDSSPLRHQLPSMYTMYGVSRTILAIEYCFISLVDILEELDEKHEQLLMKFFKAAPRVFAGLGLEAYRRKHNIVPTQEEDYHSSYMLFCVPVLLGGDVLGFCTAKKLDMKRLLTAVGFYLHVFDDYRNLHCADYMKTKGFCDDIREGKCTFPIIHAINSSPEESKVIRQILLQQTDSVEKKQQCLAILEKCGSFEYTKNVMEQLLNIIREELDKIDDHPPMLRTVFETTVIPGFGTLS